MKSGIQVGVLREAAANAAHFTQLHITAAAQTALFTAWRGSLHNRPNLESQFGIRRPIILIIFLFPLSLPSFHFLSILAVFAFMCIFVDFTTKTYVKALGKNYQKIKKKKQNFCPYSTIKI